MKRLFLLRAYGDFVIALHAFAKYPSNSPSEGQVQLVASEHLKPLYNALLSANAIPPITIQFVDFGINQGQLNFFTNKHFLKKNTFQQLGLLKQFIKNNPNKHGQDFIEQSIRLTLFNFMTGHNFKAIVQNKESVYNAYANFVNESMGEVNQIVSSKEQDLVLDPTSYKHILITPDSRLLRKAIPDAKINELQNEFSSNGNTVKIAKFNNTNTEQLSYSNFDELVQLVQSTDYLISSDSLPVHIAQLIEKPHAIVYASVTNNFCTPFALNNNKIQFFND